MAKKQKPRPDHKQDKTPQTLEALNQHLSEQVRFLRGSSESFDTGFEGEAKRLAATIRLLVHDTKNGSHSLLMQMEIKDKMGFLDTAWEFNPKNLVSHNGLTMIRYSNGEGKFVAPLGGGPRQGQWVTFTSWWNRIVFVDNLKHKFTRRDLVLAVANQDGGAHVDPALDSDYAALSRENTLGWFVSDGKTERPLPGPELPAVRQIAYELLISLATQFPDL